MSGLVGDALARIADLPGVSQAVGEARAAVDRLYGHRVLRRRGPEISAESALRGARASAALAGADVPLDEVRAGRSADPLVRGALRVTGEVGMLAGVWKTASRQALARIHTLAAADVAGEDALGRPRGVSDPGDVGGASEWPLPPSEVVSARLDALMTLLAAPTDAPALVVGAVVHGELLCLRPFGTADGLVARAAARLTFIERGLDRKALAIPEMGHLELGAAYRESLSAYGTGSADGVAMWVRHCADAVAAGAREALAVCEALQRG